ncbi:unnamed protein product (macronuclear) [Paramecium tetraurelia]|uniref:Uncharacterized protein n=1 Tax=Paramecium tetraurelia TaxID=5888 RepID=A0DXN1_PARTE|nr:uncharacterized protein GSPATT00021422001 [Paramecium tetraurelia]CAK87798.1 unnamed protein product [Paramecium tetraurelia]|eukprot:XP_001455195.1 hypothetical protein (macronuclear) [Paramecium tetraurelia strain d4-2]
MSDMFQGNKSGVSYGSQFDALGASFGRIAPQDKQSIGSNNGGGSFAQVNVSFLVQPDQYRSSVGLEEGNLQIKKGHFLEVVGTLKCSLRRQEWIDQILISNRKWKRMPYNCKKTVRDHQVNSK